MKFDIAVIGAGPAGSFAAFLLSKLGYSVALVESMPEMKRKICGEYLSPGGVEYLIRELGEEIILKNFSKLDGMLIFAPSGLEVDCQFPTISGRINFGLKVPRDVFDQFLINQAKNSGVEVFMGEEVKDLSFENKNHRLFFNKRELETSFLVGADGRKSLVCKKFNLNSKHKKKFIAFHGLFKSSGKKRNKGEMHILEKGDYIGINPISDEFDNVSLITSNHRLKQFKTYETLLEYYLNKNKYLKEKFSKESNFEMFISYPIYHEVHSISFNQGVLVGDAAGFYGPLTGEGITAALTSAQFLAQVITQNQSLKKNDLINMNSVGMNYEYLMRSFLTKKKWTTTFFHYLIGHSFYCNLLGQIFK